MRSDGIDLIEGSEFVNLTVATGTAFPGTPSDGEMFYRTDGGNVGLYVYSSGSWQRVAQTTEVAPTVHDHDGVYEPVFSKNTGFNKNLGTAAGTVAEGNHNHDAAYVDVSGDTMTGFLTLNADPTAVLHAATKQYVDNLVSASVSWRPGLVDSDLVDVVGSNPATPEATYGLSIGDNVCFIATASFTFSLGAGSTVVATAGSVVNLLITSSGNGDYTLIEHPLAAGDRFIIAAEHGTIGTGLSSLNPESNGNLANGDLIEFTGTGDGSVNASWTMPEGRSGQATHTGTEIPGGITVLNQDPDSTHYGHTYLYNAEDNVWVEIAGPGYIQAGNQLSFTGTTLNVQEGPGSGLDADTLDGQQGAYYLAASSYTAADVLAKLVTVDGSGSGLDADKWDGGNKTISSLSPSGGADGDVWFKYIP